MVSIDLYARWPSIRRRSNTPIVAVSKDRATTLDLIPGQRPRRRADTGPENPFRFLQHLVTAISGKPLSAFFPIAQGLPRLVGVDDLTANSFQEFLRGFQAALTSLGMTGGVPNASGHVVRDDIRLRLRAGALGVSPHTTVQRATPRAVLKFDEFTAQVPPNPATLAAALEAGAGDGIPIGFAESLSAFIGAMRASVLANDLAALRTLGEDFGALLAALAAVVNVGEAAERNMRLVGKNHWVAPGYETVRKSRAMVRAVEVDGVDVPVEDAEIDLKARKFVRRRRRRKE